MLKTGILGLFLLANAVAMFCAFNPWIPDWENQGLTVLAFEAVFFLLIGVPVLLYQVFRGKKSFKQSVSDSVKAIMEFVSSFV